VTGKRTVKQKVACCPFAQVSGNCGKPCGHTGSFAFKAISRWVTGLPVLLANA
jgi:hypothetical protein